jgi:sulfur carrier protein ThiS
MRVEVHLHAELARLAPDQRGVLSLDVPDGTRVADVLERFALGTEQRVIVGVNGETAPPEQELVDGARIDLLTPMAGGSLARRFTWPTVTGTAFCMSI